MHPKEVILDDDNHPNELAMKGLNRRGVLAKLEELGFKNVREVKVLGTSDRVVKILANGRPVRKMQKVPVNASIVVEVSDGRLSDVEDSLNNLEYLNNYREHPEDYGAEEYDESQPAWEREPAPAPQQPAVPEENEEETVDPDVFN